MSQGQILAHRFREVILDGTWIANTNFKKELTDLDWEMANTKVGNLNTIYLLAFHIQYYIGGVLQVLEGGSLDIRDQYSFDVPPLRSQLQWDQFIADFWKRSHYFAEAISALSAAQLEAPFVDPKYGTYHRNIDGIIEHAYYHLGQVVLIKKVIATP